MRTYDPLYERNNWYLFFSPASQRGLAPLALIHCGVNTRVTLHTFTSRYTLGLEGHRTLIRQRGYDVESASNPKVYSISL
ncbi:hypothetical protein TNIN_41151 [Trichonephila inaurata madagascariensis]|uniref:Uncharacterized protein n=1 Tax=Trichonephila inaurata madagascariensis TaxID=2747483 RepID=A0A8X7CPU8_9ARAC|nr:hypothetical protein TNIN_41151 [Trichonephila inaurata madagascariensis]